MDGLILPAIISSIRSLKDGSISVTIETQEMSPGKAGELFGLRNKVVVMYLSPKETITQRELDQIDAVDPEFEGKTQSQRIRNVLFKLFSQGNEGFKTFDDYYKNKTEKFIEHLKSKILS